MPPDNFATGSPRPVFIPPIPPRRRRRKRKKKEEGEREGSPDFYPRPDTDYQEDYGDLDTGHGWMRYPGSDPDLENEPDPVDEELDEIEDIDDPYEGPDEIPDEIDPEEVPDEVDPGPEEVPDEVDPDERTPLPPDYPSVAALYDSIFTYAGNSGFVSEDEANQLNALFGATIVTAAVLALGFQIWSGYIVDQSAGGKADILFG